MALRIFKGFLSMKTRRGWRQDQGGWWYSNVPLGDLSHFKLKITKEGEQKLFHDSNENIELQLLDVLQHATHVSVFCNSSDEGWITNLLTVFESADNPLFSLERLKISGYKNIKIRPVLDAMKSRKLCHLKSLTLKDVGLDKEDREILTAGFESGCLQSLRHLHLSGDDLGSEHLALAKAMQVGQMLALKTLQLSNNGMGHDECGAYVTAFKSGKLPSLVDIIFPYNKIGDGGTEALAWAIQSGELKNLAALKLTSNDITDIGMIALAESFQGSSLPNLTDLDLSYNRFTERGLHSLVENLRSGRLDSLKNLDMSPSHSVTGARALVDALSNNINLTANMIYDWNKFPALDYNKEKLLRRNRRNRDISAGLGTCPMVQAVFGKVYLCGGPAVGKTSLRCTLAAGYWKSLLTGETKTYVENRTRGIEVSQFSSQGHKPSKSPITLLVWDMAGQEDYHVVHNAFFPDLGLATGKATTFVIVCSSKNLEPDLEKSRQELEYWLKFIASSCDKANRNRRHVLVVMNNFGGNSNVGKYAQCWKKVLAEQREKFAQCLEIQTNPFILDVRKYKSTKQLKKYLLEHSRGMLRGEKVPDICQFIQKNLGVWSQARKHFPVLHWTDFVAKVTSSEPWTQNTLEAATKYLNEAGVLIYIDKAFPSEWGIPHKRLVVLDPNWFCRDIVGNLFLPQEMALPTERPFRMKVDSTGSISISEFKTFFESLLGKWSDSEFEDVITILLWLGLCYKGKDHNVFIPALIAENGTPCGRRGTHDLHEHGEDQWVMGFCIDYDKSAKALAPMSLWHRFQVELAQTTRFNGHVADNDFIIGKYFMTFNVDYMRVLIEVNANHHSPTLDEITIFVKPLLKLDHLDGSERKQRQVDLANSLAEEVLRLRNEVCPGVEYSLKVVWPWPASWPKTVIPERNKEVVEVKKWVQVHGLGRKMQWEVGINQTITEDQLLSTKDKKDGVSMEGSLHILNQGMREAVELGIFPPDVLHGEVSREESTLVANEMEVTNQSMSPTHKLVFGILDKVYTMDKKLSKKLDNIEDLAREGFREVLKKQKELLHKLEDTGKIFLQDRERTCPRFIYLGEKNSGAWMTLKDSALSPSVAIRLHFACEARYEDYRPHVVEGQQGLDVSKLKDWARTIAPWLKVSLAIMFISAKVAANVVLPGVGSILPNFVWQQASSLSEGMSLATGFLKEELDKHMIEGMGLDANVARWDPRELYGKSRETMSNLLGKLTPQAYEEKLGLRKVCLKYGDGSLHGIAWICNPCFEKFRKCTTRKIVSEL